MNRKIGLLILYALIIGGALNASVRAPIKNPLMFVVIWLLVLAGMVVFMIRRVTEIGDAGQSTGYWKKHE